MAKFLLASFLVLLSLGCDGAKPPSKRVRVPSVLGLEEKAALRRITRAGLCVRDISYVARPSKADRVVGQWPKPGTVARAKLRMALFVAYGSAGIYPSSQSFGNCPPTHYVAPFFEG
jgi:beta-lactam-binding protein with PASTA domain